MYISHTLRETAQIPTLICQERGDEKTKKIRLGRPSESALSNGEGAIWAV